MAEEEDKNSYFKGWYADNGDALNRRRRERYQRDPKYREKVKRWNQQARAKRNEKRSVQRRAELRAMRMATGGTWKTVELEVDGVKRRMFTIGALAKALGKGVSTIRVWERYGILPETPYRSEKGDRLYSVEMVEQVAAQLEEEGRLDRTKLRKKAKPSFVVREVEFSDGSRSKLQLFKIGSLAKAVGRTVVALTQAEKRGHLPRTPLLASKIHYRLYTVGMIEAVQRAFDRRGGRIRGNSEWESFRLEIEDEWESLGLLRARLTDESEAD